MVLRWLIIPGENLPGENLLGENLPGEHSAQTRRAPMVRTLALHPDARNARKACSVCVFVFTSAWVCAVAFCAVVRFLLCAPEHPGKIYISPLEFTWGPLVVGTNTSTGRASRAQEKVQGPAQGQEGKGAGQAANLRTARGG